MSTPSQQDMNSNVTMNPGDDAPAGTPGTGEDICPRCKGTGKQNGQDCQNCGGTGRIVEGIGGG